jgi:hypothetical protein
VKVWLIGTEQETPRILSLLWHFGFISLEEVSEARIVKRYFSVLPAISYRGTALFLKTSIFFVIQYVFLPL